ncbi:E3 ubiquitin-protein ligase RHA2A-like [Durio zibethinus]|uniref:E3 ubiquitin-protein ligase RHA2A-like n=1 Tax=Durio zibethinus TaxID=66656 RepID=A0A6P5XRM8_DURZI|nr:E3 ubiquitin-protein ligase RHA2A-like [Durio zibethinus]
MGFFVEDPGLIVTHLLYKTAVVLAVLRWVLSWAVRFKDISFFTCVTFSSDSQHNSSSSSSSSSLVSSQMIRDSLALTTLEDAKERLPWVSDTCAVCLSQLKEGDEVRELRNCRHLFHKDCIDRWVDYGQDHDHDYDHDHDNDDEDNHKTCPLCRAPLLTSQSLGWPKNEPSWAVERLLYLFGDDLLP